MQCPECDRTVDYRSIDSIGEHVRAHREHFLMGILKEFYSQTDGDDIFDEMQEDLKKMSDNLGEVLLEGIGTFKSFVLTEN